VQHPEPDSRPAGAGLRWPQTRLAPAFTALIVLLALIVASGVVISRSIDDDANRVYLHQLIPLRSAARDLALQLVNQETGVRGYLITRDPRSLAPYNSGRVKGAKDLIYLRAHADASPRLAQLVPVLDAQVADLHRFFAQEVQLARDGGADLARARRSAEAGTAVFNRFRKTAQATLDEMNNRSAATERSQKRRTNELTILLIVLGAAAIALAAGIGRRVSRRTDGLLETLVSREAQVTALRDRAVALRSFVERLAAAVDLPEVGEVFAQHGPQLAGAQGGAIILLDGETGRPSLLAAAGAGSAQEFWHAAVVEEHAIGAASRGLEALMLGAPREIESAFPGLAHLHPADRDGAWALVPLRSNRRAIGAVVVTYETRQAFGDEQGAQVLTLATRVGVALDRALLLARQHSIAHTLQQSLLPAMMPETDGIDLAAVYLPAGDAIEVGGDFYDVFETAHGLALVVGDVAGKGPHAARLTALCRYTLRAALRAQDDPQAALQILNEELRAQTAEEEFVTLTFALLFRCGENATVSTANAGHPPGIIQRAEGTLETLPHGSLPLGIARDWSAVTETTVLSGGDSLVFYTDGVTETRGNHGLFGESGVRAVIEASRGLTARALADAIARAARAHHTAEVVQDDIAILALRVDPELHWGKPDD
jgi:serine phosphatase RsbU (regulator of sigma subunit)/CHASE3 domain sensor protein